MHCFFDNFRAADKRALIMTVVALTAFCTVTSPAQAKDGPKSPTGAAGARERFNRLFARGDYGEMRTLADNYLRSNAGDAMAYYYRALAQSRGRLTMEKAIVDVDRAITIDGMVGDFYWLKATILHNQQEDELALPIVEKAYRLEPTKVEVIDTKAAILCSLHKPDDALKLSDLCVKKMPGTASFHSTRAQCLKQLSRWDDAESEIDTAVRLVPISFAYRLERMAICTRLKKWDKIVEDATWVIANEPKHLRDGYERRGRAHFMLKQYPQAISDYQQAIRETHGEALVRQLHVDLQEAYQATGDLKNVEAEKNFLKKLDEDIKPL